MKRTPLRTVSDKRRTQLAKYTKERKQFLSEKPICEVCHRGRSFDVHHSRGRHGRKLLEKDYWVAVCRSCHTLIHSNPKWARAEGYIKT